MVTKALPSMYTSMGYGVYIFFASALICASIYAFFFIPETKGLRIDQMDRVFGFSRMEDAAIDAKERGEAVSKDNLRVHMEYATGPEAS